MCLRIKKVIKSRSQTIHSVADKLKINRIGLSNHITGNPTVEILQRIAAALEVNVAELFEPVKSNEFTCPNCETKLTISKS